MHEEQKLIDLLIIQDLHQSRVATLIQIERLLSVEDRSQAAERVQLLIENGCIRKRTLLIGGAEVFCLSRKGYDLGVANGVIPEDGSVSAKKLWRRLEVSDLTLLHELQVVDARIAYERHARVSGTVQVARVVTHFPSGHFETDDGKRIFPDGWLSLSVRGRDRPLSFCLEIDRGTEPLNRVLSKVQDYLRIDSGDSANRDFRVVFVVPSEERRDNVAWLLARELPKVPNFVLIAVMSDVERDALGAIYLTPGGVRKAMVHGVSPPVIGRDRGQYRRSKMRMDAIATHSPRVSLLDS